MPCTGNYEYVECGCCTFNDSGCNFTKCACDQMFLFTVPKPTIENILVQPDVIPIENQYLRTACLCVKCGLWCDTDRCCSLNGDGICCCIESKRNCHFGKEEDTNTSAFFWEKWTAACFDCKVDEFVCNECEIESNCFFCITCEQSFKVNCWPKTCCFGTSNCCCIVTESAFPTHNEIPLECGFLGCMCIDKTEDITSAQAEKAVAYKEEKEAFLAKRSGATGAPVVGVMQRDQQLTSPPYSAGLNQV